MNIIFEITLHSFLGYSRIPIYEGERHNIVGVLFAKELAFIDSEMKTTIKTHQEYYDNPWSFVFEDTTLDVMFKDFKVGECSSLGTTKLSPYIWVKIIQILMKRLIIKNQMVVFVFCLGLIFSGRVYA